ncbi:hypothetical protein PR048_016821 [Dryococelus australis]|uniref:Uncharacterized protein n=1 Tax=Dryococelus australis TaxID=614101 RepID=A0ABQ9H7R8_9NEOP|nr:hypothetical protein PR048_016821 [Dryococelus australis]
MATTAVGQHIKWTSRFYWNRIAPSSPLSGFSLLVLRRLSVAVGESTARNKLARAWELRADAISAGPLHVAVVPRERMSGPAGRCCKSVELQTGVWVIIIAKADARFKRMVNQLWFLSTISFITVVRNQPLSGTCRLSSVMCIALHVSASLELGRGLRTAIGCSRSRIGDIWAALNVEVSRTDEGETRRVWSSFSIQKAEETGDLGDKGKARRPAASSGTISTRENPGANQSGIEPGSPRWDASSLTTTLPRPLIPGIVEGVRFPCDVA